MNENTDKAPIHLWIVGGIALLWNALGAFNYLVVEMQLEQFMTQWTPEQKDYFAALPAWRIAVWAIAVWGSLLGSLLLLMRKSWALWCFVAGLLGLAGSTLYDFGLSNGLEVMGQQGVIFTAIIWVISIGLLWYSHSQSKRGVLR